MLSFADELDSFEWVVPDDYSGVSVDPEIGRYRGIGAYSPAFDPSGENPAEMDRWRTRRSRAVEETDGRRRAAD